jgi:hypothetical protein
MPVFLPRNSTRLIEKRRYISPEDQGCRPRSTLDVAEQEPRAKEVLDQPGKVRRLRITMIYAKPTMEQRFPPAMKILPEPPCLRRSGNPSGFEQARHVPKIILIESHFLPSPQSTQLHRPMLSGRSSDANIASSSKHRLISRSGRCRRIHSTMYR